MGRTTGLAGWYRRSTETPGGKGPGATPGLKRLRKPLDSVETDPKDLSAAG